MFLNKKTITLDSIKNIGSMQKEKIYLKLQINGKFYLKIFKEIFIINYLNYKN